MGTLFGCVGVVLVASLILNSKSPETRSYITTDPGIFVRAVFREFARQQFWMTSSWVNMTEIVSNETRDIKAMYDIVDVGLGDFLARVQSRRADRS
jgi:hypothetical protein